MKKHHIERLAIVIRHVERARDALYRIPLPPPDPDGENATDALDVVLHNLDCLYASVKEGKE